MKYASLWLSISLLIFGCASKQGNPSEVQKFNNIAVISVMDAPVTPLTNTDQVITEEILARLQGSNKNSFSLQVDSTIVKAERDQALALKDMYLGNRYQSLELYFLSQAAQQKADFLLVVHPSPHPLFTSYTPGFGLYCSRIENKTELQGYFMMSSELWDVKKQEVVRRVQLSPADLNFPTGKRCKDLALSKDTWMTYKESFITLAKKSSGLILTRTGIL